MKILILSPHFSEYSVSLALALAKDHDVLLVLNSVNESNEISKNFAQPQDCRLRIVRFPHDRHLTTLFSNLFGYWRLYKQFEPDLIHCQEEPKDYLVGLVALAWRSPMVLTVHDPQPHIGVDLQRHRWSRLAFYKRFLRWRANGVLVHGERLRDEAIGTKQFRNVPVMSMPHGPLGILLPGKLVGGQRYGHCLFFGRIEPYKGLGVLIDSIEILAQRGVSAHAVIAGRGTDLHLWRSRLHDSERFTLIEKYLPADEVLALFRQAHLVVLPYLQGTQSGVAAYALGAGRPLVGTAVGSIPEMIRDGENGFVVPPGDAVALADAIQAVLNDDDLSKRMGARSAALGTDELSWDRAAQVCSQLYCVVQG
jgi:glycosyltransferase involved in cell wall biosynthesis